MRNQRWPTYFQSGSYQGTDLTMVNILSFFANQSFVIFAVAESSILHEKGGTTQLSTIKYRQQPLIQNADVSFGIDISVTHDKLRMSRYPNGTPDHNWKATKLDCWLQMPQRKNLGWKPPDPNSIAVRRLYKPGLIREDNSIPKPQRLAYHLWPSLLSALNVKRAKK